MRPRPPWSDPTNLIVISLGLVVAGVAALLIIQAEAWGLVPEGSEQNSALATLTRVLIGFIACLFLGALAGWVLAGRAAQRRACRNLEVLACKQLAIIRERVYDYMRRCGKWPPTLSPVGFTERMLINPWGHPYQYVVHGDQFTIFSELPDRLYDYFALERRWFAGPGTNLLTYDQSISGWY